MNDVHKYKGGIPGSDRDITPPSPNAWIQWKGTKVCMDVHCSCGTTGHVDNDFAYYYHCLGCDTVYMVSGFINLIPLTPEERADAEKSPLSIVTDDTENWGRD